MSVIRHSCVAEKCFKFLDAISMLSHSTFHKRLYQVALASHCSASLYLARSVDSEISRTEILNF